MERYPIAMIFLVGLAAASTVLCMIAYYFDIKSGGNLEKTSVVKVRDKKE